MATRDASARCQMYGIQHIVCLMQTWLNQTQENPKLRGEYSPGEILPGTGAHGCEGGRLG